MPMTAKPISNSLAPRAGSITSKPSGRREWLILTGLIALSFTPVAAGTVRLVQLAGGAEITADNARFFAAPMPVVLHIVSVTIYAVLGALQFSPGLRRRNLAWHRAAGKIDPNPEWADRGTLGAVDEPFL